MEIEDKLNKIKNLKENLEKDSILLKGKKEIQSDVYLGENVQMEPNVFFDTKNGKIIIGENTQIKSGAVLRGPLVIGRNCKIGGEIEHSIFQDYSNKQHHGYVGHSYIGSWVNIGGGTSIATLKNTYSNIKMAGIDTGLQFLGCIMGDYCKTAVNASIFCGKVIGVSSHLYGTVTNDVPAFTSHVDSKNLYEMPIEISLKTQKAMMIRRDVEFTQEVEDTMRELYKNTEIDRNKAGVKKEKLKF